VATVSYQEILIKRR